jgi:hypothetical protein
MVSGRDDRLVASIGLPSSQHKLAKKLAPS